MQGIPQETKEQKSLLIGRRDPIPDAPLETKLLHLKLVEDFLDLRWLNKHGSHAFKKLWKRKDLLATTELLTFGSALTVFKSKVNDSTLKKSAETIKSSDEGNSIGKIFEILAASFFEDKKQKVELPRENNPGFDFSVITDSGAKIRFSVKALIDSKHAREFKEFSAEIVPYLREKLNEHSIVFMLQNDFDRKGKYSSSLTKAGIQAAVKSGITNHPFVTYNNWAIHVNKLLPRDGEAFSEKRKSYTTLILAPFHRNEQLRFYNKIQEACDNLAKHCPDVDSKCGNGIIIRVPESISISDAKEWLASFWKPNHNCISSILILRTFYTSSDDLAQSWLTYEFSKVDNPTAIVKFSELVSSTINVTVPIGKVSTEEAKIKFNINGNQLDVKRNYWHLTGHHTYEKKIDLSHGPVKFEFKRIPNVRSSCVFFGFPDGGLEITPNYPPKDELLIL